MQDQILVGDWQINPQSNEIRRHGESVKLDYKVMQLLLYFRENAGRQLPKSEILKSVWGDEFISEEVLTVAVSSLRKALGDNPQSPTYIKTIPRFGYKMLAANPKSAASKQQTTLEFLEEKVGLRFLIISFIVILFILFLIMTRHPHP